jgi:hypothetical protein
MHAPVNFIMHWIRIGAGAFAARMHRIGAEHRKDLSRTMTSSATSSTKKWLALDAVSGETAVVMAIGAGGLLGCAYAIGQGKPNFEASKKRREEEVVGTKKTDENKKE